MGVTAPWGLRYPEGSDPVRLSQYFRNLADDTNAALDAVEGSVPAAKTVVAATLLKTIVPGSGSQTSWAMSGWASAPTVSVTLEHGTYAYIWTINNLTATQGNLWVTHHDGTPLPDGWALHLHLIAVGVAVAGQVPVLS